MADIPQQPKIQTASEQPTMQENPSQVPDPTGYDLKMPESEQQKEKPKRQHAASSSKFLYMAIGLFVLLLLAAGGYVYVVYFPNFLNTPTQDTASETADTTDTASATQEETPAPDVLTAEPLENIQTDLGTIDVNASDEAFVRIDTELTPTE